MSSFMGAIACILSWLSRTPRAVDFILTAIVAVLLWLIPSPIGQRARKREIEEVADKAAERAVLKDREIREPDRIITPTEKKAIATLAHDSTTTVMAQMTGGGRLFGAGVIRGPESVAPPTYGDTSEGKGKP